MNRTRNWLLTVVVWLYSQRAQDRVPLFVELKLSEIRNRAL